MFRPRNWSPHQGCLTNKQLGFTYLIIDQSKFESFSPARCTPQLLASGYYLDITFILLVIPFSESSI
jgi:hypothetical protein